MLNNLFLAFAIVAIIVLLFVVVLTPMRTSTVTLSQGNALDPSMAKLLRMFGGDISALLSPNFVKKQARSSNLRKVFKESGNPWKITYQEFILLRIILGIVGIIIAGIVVSLAISINMAIIGFVGAPVIPVLLYNYPVTVYKDVATTRNIQFKAQLPEAIDYLIMAISGGGYSLPAAFEEATKYIQKGIIRDEFITIVNDLKTGKTMEITLENFGERAPTEGVKAFTKALINANRQSVPMVEILRARAKASRKDLEMEIEKRVSTLPTRVTLILSPVSAVSIAMVALAPSVYTISTMM